MCIVLSENDENEVGHGFANGAVYARGGAGMSIAVNTKILSVVNFLLLIVLLVVCYQLGKYIMKKK